MKIKIPSRLHLTLISMHDSDYRQNGGVGFAIDKPSLEVVLEPSKSLEIEDKRSDGFDTDELQRSQTILSDIIQEKEFQNAYKAYIKGDVPTHMGFGSSTAVRLALIEGLYLINNEPYTQEEIITLSQRGGVSGIGIRTYFDGGMVFDIGRAEHGTFAPSSAMENSQKQLPLVCKHIDMPHWAIGICVPDIKPKSEVEEKDFFQKTCPIKPEESYEMLYHVVYGTVASAMETDIDTFAKSIRAIQSCQWKGSERGLYGNELQQAERILYDCGADAVGMSSLGPSLYFVGGDVEKIIAKAKQKLPRAKLWLAHPNSSGREIVND